MTMKKILCLALALVLCGAFAFAEDDPQTQLDAANARIAELEALVELYQPYYEAQLVVTYDGGAVFLEDVLEEYAYMEQMYAQYGIDLVAYGYDTQIKQQTAETMLQSNVLAMKADELGLSDLDEETMAGLTEEAAANYETYIESVTEQMAAEETYADYSEEDLRTAAIAYLDSVDCTQEILLENLVTNYVDEQLYNYITGDVAVTDEDVQATYDEMLAAQEADYANDSTYNDARNSGSTMLYNPEGYRQVKHVLIKFSDEQTTRLDELNASMDSLNAELEALLAPAEETEAPAEETEAPAEETEAPAEETSEEATAEEVVARTEEEINADITATQAEIDALYAELLPKAEEVVEKFNAGTAFADLIAEYNEDPGMTNEPTMTNGYAVSATSTTWDPAFTEGAMSIESVGGISAPVYGSYGIHVIYYEADIPAGPVALDEVREAIEATALENKISETYETTVTGWVEAVNPVYHFEVLE